MEGNPTGCMGLADYLGWDWQSKAGLPIVNVPGCPVQPDNFMETRALPAVSGGGPRADDSARRAAAAHVAVRQDRARRLRPRRLLRAGRFRRRNTARRSASSSSAAGGRWSIATSPSAAGCDGIGGCPNVGGICIGCTMPGFPDKFMPFMDEPPGAKLSTDRRSASTARIDPQRCAASPIRPSTRNRSGGITGADADHRLSTRTATDATQTREEDHDPWPRSRTPSPKPNPHEARKLVEMNWDPITRIVGSLGIYHQDRFREPRGRRVLQHLVDLPRLQHLHEGQGPARRPLHHQPHLRHLRRQPRHLRRATRRTWPSASSRRRIAEWIVNLGEAAEYMFDHNIFQDNLVGVDFCEQMVKETNPGVWDKAQNTAAPHADDARLPHHRRHHDARSIRSPASSIAKPCR